MNYLELEKNYYILTNIKIDDKTVFICRNKDSFLYEFFSRVQNNFVKVDGPLYSKLKQIYQESTNDYVQFYIARNIVGAQRDLIIKMHSSCRNLILKNITHLPEELQQVIIKRMDGVYYTSKPLQDKYIYACYQYSDNSINLNFTPGKEKYDISKILHELIHCCSGSAQKQSIGFLTDKRFGHGNTMLRLNEYINEAYTEILREKFLQENSEFNYNKDFVSLYSPIKSMFENVIKFSDTEKLDIAFFNGDGYEMLKILRQSFCVDNPEEIIKLSLLFDASYDSLKYEYPSRTNTYPYTRNHLVEIGKLVCDLVFNKYQKENKDIKNLKFGDIFNTIPNKNIVDKIYNESLAYISRCFDYLKGKYTQENKDVNNLKFDPQKYLNEYATIFLDCASKGIDLPIDFPEEIKSAELFNLALSKRIIKNGKFVAINNFEIIIENVFNQDKNFLPLDPNEQTEILNLIIYNPNIPVEQYSRYYPQDILANLVNKNLSTFDLMCKKDIFALFNILDKLSPSRRTTQMFYQNFLNAIAPKLNKLDLLKFYFNSLNPMQQKSLVQNGTFLFLAKKHAQLSKEEFLDFKNHVESLAQKNQNDITY